MSLEILDSALKQINSETSDYWIPKLWLYPENNKKGLIKVNPFDFLRNRLEKIEELAVARKALIKPSDKNWTNSANVYNLFVRLFSAFDHNQNGKIDYNSNFRETGTFAKTIALLPYLYSLGINTIYLLPITKIGIDEKKGDLGSPYSIKNPEKIEETLSEPYLGIGAQAEFKAFMEACKKLGIKVCLEFVFRTASVDSDLALEHPKWFYWINDNINNREKNSNNPHKYGPPIFSENALINIKNKINKASFDSLPAPLLNYRNMFDTPDTEAFVEDGKIKSYNKNGEKLKIASAFADWPPDDNQPVWSDVTYLKLYDNPNFNYISYNTVRMYDNELSQEQFVNKELWTYIESIPLWYIKEFDIDGIMIDMGHALPNKLRNSILKKARGVKADFAFWEENFSINQESKDNGYNAVLGYLPFDSADINKVKGLLWRLSHENMPLHFFSTGETHNVKRIAAINRNGLSKAVYLLTSFLPAIPFLHAGFETLEVEPVNTGLCFTDEEISAYPPEKLALFSATCLSWTNDNIIDYIRQIQKLRAQKLNAELSEDIEIEFVETSNNDLAAFKRKSVRGEFDLLIVLNYAPAEHTLYFNARELKGAVDLINDKELRVENGAFQYNIIGISGALIRLYYQ